jgi:UDPglucose--hexose-1-phosphate uridylyltransferase
LSEYRYNKLTKQWVLFAPNRAKRPFELQKNKEILLQGKESCPFEPGNEVMTPNEVARIEDEKKNWQCRVVPNLYNALSIEEESTSKREGGFEKKSGFGAHEVIIETREHHLQMFDYEIENFINYFNIIKKRVSELKRDTRLKYFSIFKNNGLDSGATLEHSHSQLIAMPFIPTNIANELKEYKAFKEEHDRSFFDDLIYDEKKFKKGIVFENSSFIAYCPYASTFSFEVIIMAKENIPTIEDCEDRHIYALSEIMQFVFSKYKLALGEIPFNMLIKNGDIQANKEDNPNRFHIQICPRIYKIAGFELDSKIHINTILPELAAQIIKE